MRVISLVPSLTEAVASVDATRLVAATDWCVEPPKLDVVRIRGTKNPDVARIIELAPDLVLANAEENREPDIAALRQAGLHVLVTDIRDVPAALTQLDELLAACGCVRPAWLDRAAAAWAAVSPLVPTRRAFVPVWRRPWMALGSDTFAGDVLARLGVANVLAGAAERYPRVSLDDVRAQRPDLVVLPDEPYAFGERDLDAFAGWAVPVAFVSGRHLTWYGPSLVEAPRVLARQLAATVTP